MEQGIAIPVKFVSCSGEDLELGDWVAVPRKRWDSMMAVSETARAVSENFGVGNKPGAVFPADFWKNVAAMQLLIAALDHVEGQLKALGVGTVTQHLQPLQSGGE
jgi:hypothetical protein